MKGRVGADEIGERVGDALDLLNGAVVLVHKAVVNDAAVNGGDLEEKERRMAGGQREEEDREG